MIALALAATLALAGTSPAPVAVRQVDRAEHGDTIELSFRIQGTSTALISEPFQLADRVRLYLDLDGVLSAPDSAALATLVGDNLLAVLPRPRAGGAAFAIELSELGGYALIQDDSTVRVRFAPRPLPAPALAAAPVATSSRLTVAQRLRSLLDLPSAKLGALRRELTSPVALAAALLPLLLLPGFRVLRSRRRRRAQTDRPGSAPVAGELPATTPRVAAAAKAPPLPAVTSQPDGRIWAARALHAAGVSTAEIAGRTGLAREAVQYLRALRDPAESAESGRNCRAKPVDRPRGAAYASSKSVV